MLKISQKHCKSYQCIQKKSQFGAVYSLVASLDCTSSKMLQVLTQFCIVSATQRWQPTFSMPKMQELDLHGIRFQQEDATWHIARVTMD